MQRRTLLTSAAATAAAVAVTSIADAGEAQAAVSGYVTNRAPLQPDAFLKLPPGATKAGGWLATQLKYQLNGLNGRMTEVSHFLQYDNTGWIHPNLVGWEELPYWLKGYASLGYVTGDANTQAQTLKWVNGILATQAGDGYFGPTALRTSLNGGPDFWPHMPMLHALRTFAEYTGDSRIVPAFTKFFQFVNAQGASAFNQSWGSLRWADTLEVVFWTYNRTGDSFLLDLARKIHANSANYLNNLPSLHNVNLAQGFREPAVYSVLSADASHRQATYNDYNTIMNNVRAGRRGWLRGRRERAAGLRRPAAGLRDVRDRRVHGQSRDLGPDHG